MATQKPPVAVLVPVYNGDRFLAETLTSIENQSYRNLRVLIRDDGSSDDSLAIAKAFSDRDDRFVVVPGGDHRGAEGNCIALTQHAGEPFVKWVMQDDPLHPRHVEKLITPMLKDSDITFAAAARQLIDADGNVLPGVDYTVPLVDNPATLEGGSAARHVLLTRLNRIGEPSVALVRSGGFDPDHPFAYADRDYRAMSDVAMWLTLLAQGPMYYTPEVLSSFRHHGAQRSQDMHVHIQCVLEWAYLFEGALRCELLEADEQARTAAIGLMDWNQQVLSGIVRANTREFDRHVHDVLNAMESLWATVSTCLGGDPAPAATAGDPRTGTQSPTKADHPAGSTRCAVDVVPGAEDAEGLSIRLAGHWDFHPAWMGRLAEISNRFPKLAVSLPLSSDDDGTGGASVTHLTTIFGSVGLDIEQTGDFSLDPLEPQRPAPMIAEELAFGAASLDFLETYLSSR